MKKTYIIPEALTVSLTMNNIIAVSSPDDVTVDPNRSIGAGSVETKGVSDVNVWDEEW